MKHFLTVLSVVLFLAVFFTPAEGASWKTFVLWGVGAPAVLYVVKLIWAELEKWDAEDSKR